MADEYAKAHPRSDGKPRAVLKSLTTFVGGGGPRFWFSVAPEQQQPNYAQVLIEVYDKHDTAHLVDAAAGALTEKIAGARIDVRQLETGKPVGIPVAIRDLRARTSAELRRLADRSKAIFRVGADAERVRDDWGSESFAVQAAGRIPTAPTSPASPTPTSPASSAAAMNGAPVTHAARRRQADPGRRAAARRGAGAALRHRRTSTSTRRSGTQKVPLRPDLDARRTTCRPRRSGAATSSAPSPSRPSRRRASLPSEVLTAAMPKLDGVREDAAARLPHGDRRRGRGAGQGLQRTWRW